MTPAEITSQFYKALRRPNGWQSIRHFYKSLESQNPSDIAEGFLATFQKRSFTAHEVGCAILWCMDIPFTRDLNSSLAEFLVTWDLSIEELPLYLSHACGAENMDSAILEIRSMRADESDTMEKLDTIQWWMSASSEVINESRQSWRKKLTTG